MPEVELILIERSDAGRRIVAHGTPHDVAVEVLNRCTDKELYAFKLDGITRLQSARRVAEEAAAEERA